MPSSFGYVYNLNSWFGIIIGEIEMKIKAAKIFIVALVISIILPLDAVFAISEAAVKPAETSAAYPVVTIKVVNLSADATGSVSESQSGPVLENCKASAGLAPNFVQETSLVNLNQPANCFSFDGVKQTQALKIHLPMAAAARASQQIFVLNFKTVISNVNYKHSSPTIPAVDLSQTAIIALIITAFVFSGKIKTSKLNKDFNIFTSFSLNRFEVLRC